MKRVKTILIGHGHLGKWHAQKLEASDSAEFIAICEIDKSKHNHLKEMYPKIQVVESYLDIINEFDAALVVAPTTYHYNIVKELIKYRKHIFCEKPLCRTYAEAVELIEMIGKSSHSQVIQVGQSERFHSLWEDSQIASRLSGNSCLIEINRYAPFKGRATDVDVVTDLMIHDLDLLNYLLNKNPIKVFAHAKKVLSDHFDVCSATLSYADGTLAHIHNGRCHHVEKREVMISVEGEHILFDLSESSIQTINENGDSEKKMSQKRDHLHEEQKAFYKSILNGEKAIVDINDGMRAVYLVEKVLKSAITGKEVLLEEL